MHSGIEKLIRDLEFDKVRVLAAEYCSTASGKQHLETTVPLQDQWQLMHELRSVNEYLDSLENIALPSLQSGEILEELRMMRIQNFVLNEEQFAKIAHLSSQVNYFLKFLINHEELFDEIRKRTKEVFWTDEIIKPIYDVLDRKGTVKSSASAALANIRRKLGNVRKQIDLNFNREIAKYRSAGYLDDTRESFINGRRVLSVQSEHKRKIKGSIVGSSNSGKLSFIEPQANVTLNNELAFLEQEEKDEIQRILKALTEEIRAHLPLLKAYQELLVDLDQLQAKAHFARSMQAILPVLIEHKELDLVDAFHPLLFLQNKKEGSQTLPQSLKLTKDQRLLVISGPNAGGKSITLKTVGLLQVMLQSGFLIPVKEQSKCCFFSKILSDIGDNQSIENHLSTYSYRLQNMRMFLEEANSDTLFLIDEFGSGSDPELGGALAEVFFEALYEKQAFGVITTHYSNIKVLADHMPEAFNACMLFDRESLEPLFQLSVGQPGSSFTFEVAQKNRIPLDLIEKAKNRAQTGKLRLDESIAALQKEKAMLDRYREDLRSAEAKADNEKEDFEIRKEEYEFKIMRLQQTQQDHNDYINYGKRMLQFIDQYNGKNHRKVAGEVVKLLKIEFTKRQEEIEAQKVKAQLNKGKTLVKKKKKKLAPIDPEKKEAHRAKKVKTLPARPIQAGDRVKIEGSTQIGEVMELDKNKVTVSFGIMKTKTTLDKLTLVEG